ncbi:MAG: FecR family protein [Bacteroidota bacterium]
MKENTIENIIARVLNGTSTLIDRKELETWRKANPGNELIFRQMKAAWEAGKPRNATVAEKAHMERIVQRARLQLNAHAYPQVPEKTLRVRKFFRYAAAVTLLLSTGFISGRLLKKDQVVTQMAEVVVSRGSRAQVTLPDGSMVWLGHDSRLSYPDRFTGKVREVSLNGEAFFDVAGDKENPFLVHTSGPTIRVTGTRFYVQDFTGEKGIEASLYSGKIDLLLNNRLLKKMVPGQRLVYDRQTGILAAEVFEPEFYEYWLNGDYSFTEQSFSHLAYMMKRIYNVELIFNDKELMDKKFTGSMSSDDNIYTLLEIFRISSSVPFDYSIDRNKIYIRKRR